MPSESPAGRTPRASRTRVSLLTFAGDLLEQDGLEAVTLRALGAAAGVSRGAPYRHFAHKDELMTMVAVDGVRHLHNAMSDAARRDVFGRNPLGRLEGVLVAYLDEALRRPAHYRLVFGADRRTRESPAIAAELAPLFELLLKSVADAQEAGAISSSVYARRIAAALWSAVHGIADLTLSGLGTPDKGLGEPRSLVRQLLSLFTSRGGR